MIIHHFIKEFNNKESIHFQEDINNKIKSFSINKNNLLIVTDFDFTLTYLNSENPYSSFAVFENSDLFTGEAYDKIQKNNEKYEKYENDISLEKKEKHKLMESWMRDNFEIYCTVGFSQLYLKEMLIQSKEKFYFRQGIIEFFKLVEENNINLVIVSAGLYDIINVTFETLIPNYEKIKEKNLIKIIGNKFLFDENGYKIKGYNDPIIQTFSKKRSF